MRFFFFFFTYCSIFWNHHQISLNSFFFSFVIVHKNLFLYYFLHHMSKPWISWLYFSLHLLYTSIATILMIVLHWIQGMSRAIWICTISHNHPICKKVMFPWKRSCWYHSIIWRLINRIWVYLKCNFNFPNTDAIL